MKLFGVNYIDYKTRHWPPHPWQDFNTERLKEDFKTISSLGFKLIRIFLTAYSFMPSLNKISYHSLEKLDLLLRIAKDYGLKVILTGPDHWEGWPKWMPQNKFTDNKMREGLCVFWETITKTFNENEAIYAWDILNEPEIEYLGPEKDKQAIFEYQKQRERTATEWIRFQSKIIKRRDTNHPVTLGLSQSVFPLKRCKSSNPSGYNPFQPKNLAPFLDFISIHFYPNTTENFIEDNLELLLAWVVYAMIPNKPLCFQEFGMWGGGKPLNKNFAREDLQDRWGKIVINNTYCLVDSWLNWPFIDIPIAKDISSFTGLLNKEKKLKKWGKTFSEFSLGIKRIQKNKRKIIPIIFKEKDVLANCSVKNEFDYLIKKQKKEKIIYKVILK